MKKKYIINTLKIYCQKLKKNSYQKYESNKNYVTQIDSICCIDFFKKEIMTEINNKRKKYIELLINIYCIRKNLENKIMPSLKELKNKKYFIVQNELIEKILKSLQYEEFVKTIKDNNLLKIINNYNNLNLDEEKIYNKYFEDLLPKIKKKFLPKI